MYKDEGVGASTPVMRMMNGTARLGSPSTRNLICLRVRDSARERERKREERWAAPSSYFLNEIARGCAVNIE